MVMQGFKSFARKTEIPFEDSMNVIVGPNGSGKSNITDALCFVLGRLSIKSIRAAKAANLIFSGNKTFKGSLEASVELVFDNSDKTFAVDEREVTIKRIVRKNGQSIYKINGATKTRQDLLELLSQGGIDPNGFNIVLQGEIQSLVKSTAEERRKIIEEVAGISIYETRKSKSLKELEKTTEKLKEVSAVLKERNSYLRNLDRERQEAVSYKNLDEVINRAKATLVSKSLKDKEKELWALEKIVTNHEREIEKVKKNVALKQQRIDALEDKIIVVNKHIQSSTGDEQEFLHRELADLKAELAGLVVRRENFESRIESEREKVREYKEKISVLQEEVSQIQTKSPEIKKQQEEHKALSEKFDMLEQQRRKFYILKSELSTLEHEKHSREKNLIESKKEISLIEQTITSLFHEIKYAKSAEEAKKKKQQFEDELAGTLEKIKVLEKEILESERESAVFEKEIEREDLLQRDVSKIDFCPICKQEVGENHKHDISKKATEKIELAKKVIERNENQRSEHKVTIEELHLKATKLRQKSNEVGIDLVKIKMGEEKKETIKRVHASIVEAEQDITSITKKLHSVRKKYEDLKDIEEQYDQTRLLLQDLTFHDLDVDTEISLKRREINRLNTELKSSVREIEDSTVELKRLGATILEKEKFIEKKELEEQRLYEKFQKYFQEKNELQDQQKVAETDMMGLTNTIRNFEEKINENKIYRAQFTAQIDSLKTELATFGSVELLNGTVEQIKERLQKAQFRISKLGNVNLRALEVFEKVKEQCILIEDKVAVIEREKEDIEKIILEIDKKKKKSFMTTLKAVNELFTRNFSQLSRKSSVFLELENKKEPFEGGLNILVKVSRGRYFDITSLSGGEKTMVALSLIFAIQEYKPYCFYIFDEIDAALDKHNSELLAALIKKYMKSGQYIIITHNDTLISEGKNLYGVSMQENISKIISLKV